MPLNLGSSAVSLYLGDQSVTGYLGSQIVTATVPGAPTITSAEYGEEGEENLPLVFVKFTDPESDGGSPVTGYVFYYKGDPIAATFVSEAFGWRIDPGEFAIGQEVQVSAVNAIGEGPKSEPFIVTGP